MKKIILLILLVFSGIASSYACDFSYVTSACMTPGQDNGVGATLTVYYPDVCGGLLPPSLYVNIQTAPGVYLYLTTSTFSSTASGLIMATYDLPPGFDTRQCYIIYGEVGDPATLTQTALDADGFDLCPCAMQPIDECIYTDLSGAKYLKITGPIGASSGHGDMYIWLTDAANGSVLTGSIALAPNAFAPDPDGIHWDYYFDISSSYFAAAFDQYGCVNFYYSTTPYDLNSSSSSEDPTDGTWAQLYHACPCENNQGPEGPTACYTLSTYSDGTSFLALTLIYPYADIFMNGGGVPQLTDALGNFISVPNIYHPVPGKPGYVYTYVYSVPSADYPTNAGECLNLYYNINGVSHPFTVCACTPSIQSGCYSPGDNGHGSSSIQLSVPVDPNFPSNVPQIYLYEANGTPIPASSSNPANIDPGNSSYWDLHFDIPLSDVPEGGVCFTVYYSQNGSYTSWQSDDIPADVTPYQICPCCRDFSYSQVTDVTSAFTPIPSAPPYTVSFNSATVAKWDFGDGSPLVSSINPTHTYSSAGTYTVCATTTTAAGNKCVKCVKICVAEPHPGIEDETQGNGDKSGKVECNPNFTATFNPATMTLTVTPEALVPSGEIFQWKIVDPSTMTTFAVTPFLSGAHSFSYGVPGFPSTPIIQMEGDQTIPISGGLLQCFNQMSVCTPTDDAGDDINANREAQNVNMQPSIGDVQLAPNPTSDISAISFNLSKDATVKINVTDVTGRTVSTVVEAQMMKEGEHNAYISTANLPSGVYIVNIQVDKSLTTKRLSVVR